MKKRLRWLGRGISLASILILAITVWTAYINGIVGGEYAVTVRINHFGEAHFEALVLMPVCLVVVFLFVCDSLGEDKYDDECTEDVC